MFVVSSASCIRVTYVDSDKKEANRQEKMRQEGKRDPTSDDLLKAGAIIFIPFLVIGLAAWAQNSNNDPRKKGPMVGGGF